MALSLPRIFFSIHSFTPYSRTTGLPFGTILVLGGSTFNLSGELASLFGGSSKFAFAVEDTTITAELSIKPKEYPDFLFELFLGKAPTATGVEATGSVTAVANKLGTSVVANTGVASVAAKGGSETDMKFTRYVIKAVSPTTFDVYAMTNIDFARGTDKTFENDALKITPAPLTLVQSAAVEVVGFGIEVTGDSGVIALVTDDTAIFEVKPPSNKSVSVVVGGSADVFPEFGAIVMAQKNGAGEMMELDIFRLKAIGLPFNLEEKAFSEPEITAQAFQDAAQGGVFEMRHITPS